MMALGFGSAAAAGGAGQRVKGKESSPAAGDRFGRTQMPGSDTAKADMPGVADTTEELKQLTSPSLHR